MYSAALKVAMAALGAVGSTLIIGTGVSVEKINSLSSSKSEISEQIPSTDSILMLPQTQTSEHKPSDDEQTLQDVDMDEQADWEDEDMEGYQKRCVKSEKSDAPSVCIYTPITSETEQNLVSESITTPEEQLPISEEVLKITQPKPSCQTQSGLNDSENAQITVCLETSEDTPKLPEVIKTPKKEDQGPRVPTFWEILYELWKAFTSTDRLRAF